MACVGDGLLNRGDESLLRYPLRRLKRFLDQHRDKVDRASKFSQLDPNDRRAVIERARALAACGERSLNQVAGLLAGELGRAKETLRVILEQYDQENPLDRIFTRHTGPLTLKQKRVIERAVRMKISIDRIAHRFGRSPSTIHRIVRNRRAAAIRRLKIRYFHLPLFDRDDADEILLSGEPLDSSVDRLTDFPQILDEPSKQSSTPLSSFPPFRVRSQGPVDHQVVTSSPWPGDGVTVKNSWVADLPKPLKELFDQPPLALSMQRFLIVRYNYLCYKASHIRDGLDPYEARVADLDEIEIYLQRAASIKQQLVMGNVAAVLAVVRQHLITQEDRSIARLVEMLEVGISVLLDAVERFDPSTNRTLTTFLKWRLMQRFVNETATSDEMAKARRQLNPQAVWHRMCQTASRHGITLLDQAR